jgi:hypothetical protein
VLVVTIGGVAPDTLELDAAEMERALAPSFLHVRVRDRSVADLADQPHLPADTVAGRFLVDLAERVESAEAARASDEAELARSILRLGRRLLLDDPDRVTLP